MDSRDDERGKQGIFNEKKASSAVVKKTSSVIDKLFQKGYRFNFFQAVYLLERLYQDSEPPGGQGQLSEEAIRFQPSNKMSFPPAEIYHINKKLGEQVLGTTGRPEIAQMVVSFMGLYGVDSPLPPFISELIARLGEHLEEEDDDPYMEDESQENSIKALRGFLDIFNHRLYSLFYQSWKKYRYHLQFRPGARDRFSQYMMSFLGLGTSGLQELVGIDTSRLIGYTGLIGRSTRRASGLRGLLSDYFGGIDVKIIEFMPRWVPIPDSYRARLGRGQVGMQAQLGENMSIGNKIRDFSGKFRIVLTPKDFEGFRKFLPGGDDSRDLYRLVRLYVLEQLSFDVELMLAREEVPPLQLGTELAQLGWTSWLGRPHEDMVSAVFSLEAQHEELSTTG